jgi:membrane protease YdiL (CAAX protease family)
VDETPEIPEAIPEALTNADEGAWAEAAVGPPPSPATLNTIVRDALFDLGAALGVGLGAVLLGSGVMVVGALIFQGNARWMGDLTTSPWSIAGLLLMTQIPLLYFGLRRRRRNREKQRPIPNLFGGGGLNAIPIGVFAGLGLTVLSALYTGALQRFLGPDSVQNQVEFLQAVLNNKPAVILLVVLIAGLAPMCEELFFRGVIFGTARAAGLEKAGAVISGLLFASVHLSLLLAPFYILFALVMCWLYARTGTLAASIAAHATLNGIACASLLLVGDRV